MMTGDQDENSPNPTVSQRSVHQLIARIRAARARTIALYWYDARPATTAPAPAAVAQLADSNPPPKSANYVPGRFGRYQTDCRTAARPSGPQGLSSPPHWQRNPR